MNTKNVEAAITAKAAELRARKLSGEYIARQYDHYYTRYKHSVTEHDGMSIDYYVTFKAYEKIAKERGLL